MDQQDDNKPKPLRGSRSAYHQHPFKGGGEPKGTRDSVADNTDLLANIRGMAKTDLIHPDRLKHASFENDYAIDSLWWQLLEKRDEWDRIRDLPLSPSLRRALFTCAVNDGLDAAIAMLATVNAETIGTARDEQPKVAPAAIAAEPAELSELEVEVVAEEVAISDSDAAIQAPPRPRARVVARNRTIKPRDYDFGERTLRYTKYQFYLLYRQPWVKKVIRRARDNRPDVA